MLPSKIEQIIDRALRAVYRNDERAFAEVVNSLDRLLKSALTPDERDFIAIVVTKLDQIPLCRSWETLREVSALRVWVLTTMARRGWITGGQHA